jgi:hypothetical protein
MECKTGLVLPGTACNRVVQGPEFVVPVQIKKLISMAYVKTHTLSMILPISPTYILYSVKTLSP